MKTTTAPAMKSLRTPFEVKSVDEDARTFTGLASTWNTDLGGDVIEKGAYKRTLRHWKTSKRAMPLIDQHNYGSVRSVVGKMEEGEETDPGLVSTFSVIEGPDGDEIWRRVKGGYVDGLSIGYEPVEVRTPTEDQKRAGIRRFIKELKLYEVSLVIWPMNTEATVSSVKQLFDAARAGTLTPEQKNELRALLDDPAPADEEADTEQKGLAHEDPRRIAMEATLRDLTLRSLATA